MQRGVSVQRSVPKRMAGTCFRQTGFIRGESPGTAAASACDAAELKRLAVRPRKVWGFKTWKMKGATRMKEVQQMPIEMQ